MNDVIVDTSVWVSYFRGDKAGKRAADALEYLLSGDEARATLESRVDEAAAGTAGTNRERRR